MKQIKMEETEVEMKSSLGETTNMSLSPPTPPPPPPLPTYWIKPVVSITTRSVTNQEIAKYWRQKKIDEEDHLLAAIKAAARVRARNLTEEDYRLFEESLDDTDKDDKINKDDSNKSDGINNEIRVGIKDWWTKSKYAYLNQPAVDDAIGRPKKTSTYIPNFCFYKPPPTPPAFGVF